MLTKNISDSLYESMNEGVCLHEIIYNNIGIPIDYYIIDSNPAYESITGLRRSKIVEQKATKIYGVDEPPYLHTYARVAETGEPTYFETFFPQLDKHFLISVICPEKGKFLTIFSDITHQKDADSELKTIYDNSPVIFMMLDTETKIIKVNKNAELFVGKSSDELTNLKGGDALRCLNSLDDPKGCGFGPNCKECQVRKTVMDTLETGSNHFNVEASLPFMLKGYVKYLTFLISTSLNKTEKKSKILVTFLDITERKRTQEKLNKEKEFFERLAETSPVGITKLNKKGNVVYANQVAEKILGLKKNCLKERTYNDIKCKITDIEGNYYSGEYLPFELVKSNLETVFDVRLAINCKDGERKQLSINASPLFDELNNFDGVIATVEDITEYKQKEDSLYLMKNTLESSINAVAVANLDGYLNHVNSACLDLWEYNSEEEILDKHFTDFWLYKENASNVYHQLYENGSWKGEGKAKTKHGKILDVYGLVNLVNNESGKPIAIAGSFIDITKRKLYEEKLKESEQRFRTLVENATDAIIAHDINGDILYINDIACEYLDYNKNELISMNIADIDCYIKNIKDSKNKYWDKLSPNNSYRIESSHRRKDGTHYPVEVKMTRISLNGEPIIIGFCRDITVRKQAEENLINSKLEAEAANQSKSELLANVSHELRTPLTSILGFSDVMLKGKSGELNDNQQRYLCKIHDSGQHLLNLINDILDLSKIESGKLELHYAQLKIYDIFMDLKDKVHPFISKKGIELNINIDYDVEYIYADEIKLKQIIYNLLYNAVKFTNEGYITVEVYQVNENYQFKVIDTGIGIPKNKQDEIFESFRQLDSGTNRRYSGTGLGLTLVKNLVKMHGGQVWVNSVEGKGSEFIFNLPKNVKHIKNN